MIGAATFINPILKIVTTVAVLGAAYLFILKPVLDTGSEISGNISESFPNLDGIQQQIEDSIESTEGAEDIDFGTPDSAKQARRLGACVDKAEGDVEAIERCADRFAP